MYPHLRRARMRRCPLLVSTHPTAKTVPAGWYLDPTDSSACRWWDWAAYTDQARTAQPATALNPCGRTNPVSTNSCFPCGATVERAGANKTLVTFTGPPADSKTVSPDSWASHGSAAARPQLTGTLASSQTRST